MNQPDSFQLQPTARHSSTRRWLVRAIFSIACFATLLALFFTEENWRGRRAWEQCRKELTAKGANLNWNSYIPAPVPDEQNIFKAPAIEQWLIKDRSNGSANGLSFRFAEASRMLALRTTNRIARVVVLAPGTAVAPDQADVVVPAEFEAGPGPNEAVREHLGRQVCEALWPSNRVRGGGVSSLQGAQTYTFLAQPTSSVAPVRVVVFATNAPGMKKIAGLFPPHLLGPLSPKGESVRVEPAGPGTFDVFLSHPMMIAAADYLACTDDLAPEFDLLRNALQRPSTRIDGDYEHPWAMPIPHYVAIRNLAQTLSQRAQCCVLLGRPEAALREMTLLRDLSRLLDNQPVTLVSAMINVAITGLYASTVGDGLRLRAWHEPQLVALQRQLEQVRLLVPVIQAFQSERAATCHTLEILRTPDLNTVFAFDSQNQSFWEKVTSPEHLLLRWMPRGWVYQNMATIASRNQWFIESSDTTNNRVFPRRMEKVGREAIANLGSFSPYTFLAAAAVPNFLRATQTMAMNQAMVNEALLACALERYHLAHSDYPETLADLSPQFLAKLPADMVNGEPYKYRRVDPQHFLLYSVGWNETDEGGVAGKTTAEGDWVWQPAKQ
jgi:hypothetical protein